MRRPSACFFVIIFEGRTGSSYTVSCLNSHPRVLCYPEILANRQADAQAQILDAFIRGKALERLPFISLNDVYFHGAIDGSAHRQAVGLKTKLFDIRNLQRFFIWLGTHRVRLVYLKRRNLIKSALSMLNAYRLVRTHGDKYWNATQRQQVQGAIYVPPAQLIRVLRKRIRHERWHERFYEAYGGEKRLFYYETLLQHRDRFFEDLLQFLGADLLPLHGRLLKNTPDRLSDAIVNYGEIRDLFAGTYFDRFFDEG